MVATHSIHSFWPLIVFFLAAIAMMIFGYAQQNRLDMATSAKAPPTAAAEVGRSLLYLSLAYILSFILAVAASSFKGGDSYAGGHAIVALVIFVGLVTLNYAWPALCGDDPHGDDSAWMLQGCVSAAMLLFAVLLTLPVSALADTDGIRRWGNPAVKNWGHVAEAMKAAAVGLGVVPITWFMYAQNLAFEPERSLPVKTVKSTRRR